ncbi:MAG: efflux RND transporter periplasmic adaptor subunit [Niabella sp.]
MKKIVVPIAITLAVLAGIIFVLNKNKASNAAQTALVAQKNTGVAVRAAIADYKDLTSEYTTNGLFTANREVMISSEVSGRVVRVFVDEGSVVSAGQTLAVVEGDKQNVSLSNARAVYNNAQAEVARFENAYATGGVTKQQLDQVKLQLENAKNSLRSAQISASDVNIRASFSGIINKRNVEPGLYVSPGQGLFEIVNISTLKLKVNVDEKMIGSVKSGQQVLVKSSVLPDQQWIGIVSFIAPKADGSLNFPVELTIKNNGKNDLKAGMYGTAIFGSEQSVSAFVVPRTAFLGNVSSNQVFVVKGGEALLTEVVSGTNFGDYVEIISGIQTGDTVVTTGQINLAHQTPVQIIQ